MSKDLEQGETQEVALLSDGTSYSIDLIDAHLATESTVPHQVFMDYQCDRFFCRPCDVWIEPKCDCNGGQCPTSRSNQIARR